MDLKTLQEQLFKAITLKENEAEALNIIRDTGSMSAKDRLGVYQYAYQERIKECIEDDYPNTCKLLGDKSFHELFENFITTQLSPHWNINGFSVLWNNFIQQSHCEEPLKELCQYEWMKVESFYKHNRKVDPLYKTIVLSEEHNANVRLDDSVILKEFNHKVIHTEEKISLPEQGHSYIIFWTRKFANKTGYLTKIEYHLALSLTKSSDLDQVIADMAKLNIDDVVLAENFQRTIASFMEQGILIQV